MPWCAVLKEQGERARARREKEHRSETLQMVQDAGTKQALLRQQVLKRNPQALKNNQRAPKHNQQVLQRSPQASSDGPARAPAVMRHTMLADSGRLGACTYRHELARAGGGGGSAGMRLWDAAGREDGGCYGMCA